MLDAEIPSNAFTENAGSTPKEFETPFHRTFSPAAMTVVPALAAVQPDPSHFSSVVEAVTPSILKLGLGVSMSASSPAFARSE